jgi:hypothetical protein
LAGDLALAAAVGKRDKDKGIEEDRDKGTLVV